MDPSRIMEPMNVVNGPDGVTKSVLGYRLGDLGLISIHKHGLFWCIIHLPSGLSIAAHHGIFMNPGDGWIAMEHLSKMSNTWDVPEGRLKKLLRAAAPALRQLGGIKMIPGNVTDHLPAETANQPKDDL